MDRRVQIHLSIPEQIPALHALPEHPPLSNPYPLWILPSTLLPRWPDELIPSPITLELPPFPQGNDISTTLLRLNKVGEGLTNEALLEWALDMLCSPEDWRWFWSPEPVTTPLSSPTPNQLLPLWYSASNANPLSTSVPNAQSTYAPSVRLLLPDTLNALASCAHAPFAENSVMWAPVAQPQLQPALPLSLPKWAILEDFELVSQGYEGGNVTVEEAPISFSLFSLVDCILLSHFSFNNFVAIVFLDLARDLDIQI